VAVRTQYSAFTTFWPHFAHAPSFTSASARSALQEAQYQPLTILSSGHGAGFFSGALYSGMLAT
jgi:hypothetical protein